MASLFTYILTVGALKACNMSSTLIVINDTNAAFSDFISAKYQNRGLEAFVEFLKARLLRYALAGCTALFYYAYVASIKRGVIPSTSTTSPSSSNPPPPPPLPSNDEQPLYDPPMMPPSRAQPSTQDQQLPPVSPTVLVSATLPDTPLDYVKKGENLNQQHKDKVNEALYSPTDVDEEGCLDLSFLGDSVHVHVMPLPISIIFPTGS
ncbi:unnamed protein product [Lactuca virosa]|uniref:Uncharacterized protein n=1 Tax=Lactuca virosa TaxID=75947 RepID=A0AAU9P357_9ASTR|nr:unnamed protein product [Lactuca virosa]